MQRPDFQTIPDYASDDVAQKILDLAVEPEPIPCAVECSEHLIRHWCETVEDGNPLYLNEEYARSRGFRGLVAQPGMIVSTLTVPYRWPWPPEGHRPDRNIHFELKALLGLPVGILVDWEVEFEDFIQVGDRLSTSSRLLSISDWRKTKLGEGHFWTQETNFRNQVGKLVARSRTNLFGYGNPNGRPAPRNEQ
jgi:acyl dehydratase